MNPFTPATLVTRRLRLLPLRLGHAAEMAEVLADPELYVFTGGEPLSPIALHARYERLLAGAPDPAVTWCNWVVQLRSESCLTGTLQATVSPSGDRTVAEVAWVIGTAWQGRGIAREAARELVAWLRQRPVHDVVAHIHPSHRASAAVAGAVGMTNSGVRHEGEDRWQLRRAH